MIARLNHPQRVRLHGILITRHLLLLISPLRQLNLMRKQITPRQHMPQPKLCPQRLQRFRPAIELNDPIVIRVAYEARHTVRGDLVLEFNLGYGRTEVVRVQVLFGGEVAELEASAVGDESKGVERLPVVEGVALFGTVKDAPFVVLVDVGVESDLLL